jgi:hypothetical protein
LNFNEQQRKHLANSILKRLFAFEQTMDRADSEELNKFLEATHIDVTPFSAAIFEQLEKADTCDLSTWFTKGSAIDALPYVTNSMELSNEVFDKLTQFLDSTVSIIV